MKSNALFYGLGLICFALAAADFFVTPHPVFDIERTPFFYCAIGFTAYATLILLAKALRRFIMRPEDYYGTKAVDSEDGPRHG